jgi:HAD superfamily phosphoserine phosphatase-like hydrolase
MSARVAAFFDLDGTLLPLPSVERRLFRVLRYHREIPMKNYFLWLREALKLVPRGIGCVMHANKMYLRGAHSFDQRGVENRTDSYEHGHSWRRKASQGEGQVSLPPNCNPRWPVPHFFQEGVERVAWHAMQGHAIVIVSGTLEPLAIAAARTLEMELKARGIAAGIQVFATKLEESHGRWTGRILGEAIFGEAKARAIFALAEEMSLALSQSWAYGDSAQDRWMLESVGNPAAVNPTPKLARIAWKQGWPILRTANRVQQISEPLPQAERCA